jgi:peptidoglycan/xylan/chitin deacetylase (PgdA/CDA1 family)
MGWPGITRASLVCLRFDDYHQALGVDVWQETLSAYDERGLRGVVAVAPAYEGERLSADVVPFLMDLEASGWELAQHGYTHEDVGTGRGGPLYDERSEFAGLPLAEQKRRVGAGRDVLESHGIEPTTFIPPWHEYDRNTVRAVSEQGFDCINEGRWPLPRTVEGVTLVPTHVPWFTPEMVGVGVVTLVGHPHLEDDPMANARALVGRESRLRTPAEVVDWWRNRSAVGRAVDAFEPLYSLYSK